MADRRGGVDSWAATGICFYGWAVAVAATRNRKVGLVRSIWSFGCGVNHIAMTALIKTRSPMALASHLAIPDSGARDGCSGFVQDCRILAIGCAQEGYGKA